MQQATYRLRLDVFDAQAAREARKGTVLDESGLSLQTSSGLPLALDRQAIGAQTIPRDLFGRLGDSDNTLRAGRRALNPAAKAFDPNVDERDRIEPVFEPLVPLDYRFGEIRVEFEDMKGQAGAAAAEAEEARAKGSIDIGFGTVHLFRDTMPSSTNEECTILGVLAIPPVMTMADFLAFLQPGASAISQIRWIRDALPNRCMALLKFREAEYAALFQEEYNGKPFWAMLDDEICHIVRIRSVEVTASTTPPFVFPLEDARPPPGPSGAIELPTCPVCLEKLDSSVTGLATTLCGHQYHCSCLSKWAAGSGKCPVCRYSQTRSTKPPEEPSTASMCDVCGAGAAGESLWMCLLCGHVGCGRYQGGHAAAHYTATGHFYSIELDTQRVWSYPDDSYVHRLILNKTDGKLVELPSRYPEPDEGLPGVPSGGPNRATRQAQEKAEAIGQEYQSLLTSQLASQRSFYSDMVADLKQEVAAIESRAQEESVRLEAKAKRADKAVELSRALQKDLASERAISQGLLVNLQQLRDENRKAREETAQVRGEVQELQEQVRDLMFALSAREKLESTEMAGGTIESIKPPPSSSRTNATPSPNKRQGRKR